MVERPHGTDLLTRLVSFANEFKQKVGRNLPVTRELGELYACSVMSLMRETAGAKGFDATDADGKRVQIKARAPSKTGTSVDPGGRIGRFQNWEFDYAVLVLLRDDYELDEIWKARVSDLQTAQDKVKNLRAGIHVSTFLGLGDKVFPR
jgi:hypothetical protein